MSSLNSPHLDCPRARPGRPPTLPEAQRRRRILDAAEQVFTQTGYRAATMEEVARMAGMSKKTVYALFTDKRHLFSEVVGDTDAFTAHIDSCANHAATSDPLSDMRRRLLMMLEFVLLPKRVKMTRLLIAEAEHAPELADEFHKRVMRKGRDYLIEGLRNLANAGVPLPGALDPENMATLIFGAVLGDLNIRALFGIPQSVTREQLLARIDAVLAMVQHAATLGPPAARPDGAHDR